MHIGIWSVQLVEAPSAFLTFFPIYDYVLRLANSPGDSGGIGMVGCGVEKVSCCSTHQTPLIGRKRFVKAIEFICLSLAHLCRPERAHDDHTDNYVRTMKGTPKRFRT